LEDYVMPDRTYKVIELIGTSTDSWEKAAATVVERVRPQPGAIPRALRLIKHVV
jgi:flavin-binding protein dodecin